MQARADNLHPKYTAGYTYSYYSTSVSSYKVKSKQISHLTANGIKVAGSEISGDNCAELGIPEASNTISGFIAVAAGDAVIDKTIGLQLASESPQSRFRPDGTSSVSALLTQHANFNGNGIIFETSFNKNNQGNLVADDFVLDMTLTGGRHISGYLELDYNNKVNSTDINKPRNASRHVVKLASVTDYFRAQTVYKVSFDAIKIRNDDPTQNDLIFSLGGYKTNITIGTSETTHTFEVDADAAKILGKSLSLTVEPEGEPALGGVNRFRLFNLQISAHTPTETVTEKIVGAWDFNHELKDDTSSWKAVPIDTLTSGSKIDDITVTLTDTLNDRKAMGSKHNISNKATFANDTNAIMTFDSNTSYDHAVYNDFLVVGDTNPVMTISGLELGKTYEIQWIATFVVDDYKILVEQNGDEVDDISVALSERNKVVYSTPYVFTATDTDPNVEFAFKQEKGGFRMAYGISGLVIRSMPDVIAPTCTELKPVDDTMHVNVDDNLVMTFCEPIAVKGGNITIKNLTDVNADDTIIDVTDKKQVSVDGTVLTIDPANDLNYLTEYAVLIDSGAVQDLNNNIFTGIEDEHTWNFTTRIHDTSPPSVTAYSPKVNSQVVIGADLALTFDEPIKLGHGNITIKNLSNTNAVDIIIDVNDKKQVYAYGEVLTINPSDDLVVSNTYTVLIDNGAVEDESGNSFQGITKSGKWQFIAKKQDGPNIILIFSDDHGYTDLGVHGYDKYVRTPKMDTLAREGALMTSGYSSSPQCTPSRAGLMSGRIQN
jgi:methionine-rich copper-binding protein CopC